MSEQENKPVVKKEITIEDFRPANDELKALILEYKKLDYFNKIISRVESLASGAKNENK